MEACMTLIRQKMMIDRKYFTVGYKIQTMEYCNYYHKRVNSTDYQASWNLTTQSMIWISKKDPMPLSTEAASLVTKHYILGKGGTSGWLSICSRWFFNCSSRFSVSKWRKNLPSQREAVLHWNFLGKRALVRYNFFIL